VSATNQEELNAIVSAMQTLEAIEDGDLLKKLAVAINHACASVRVHGKKATVNLKITFAPLSKSNLVDPPIAIWGDITEKLPRADPRAIAMYIDANDNPSRFPPRKERDLGLNFGGSNE